MVGVEVVPMHNKNTTKDEPVPVPASAGALVQSAHLAGAGSSVGGIMHKLAHFPFYPRDFMSDPRVETMTNAELGAYLRLLCCAWNRGTIPASWPRRALVMREPVENAKQMWKSLATCFFHTEDGRLSNKRLEEERTKAIAKYEGQLQRAARARESKVSSNVNPNINPNINPTTQNSELSKEVASTNVEATKSDVEKWNDRLAPLAAALAKDEKTKRAILGYWKDCGADTNPQRTDQAEAVMWGLRFLIDKQMLDGWGLPKGAKVGAGIFRSPRADILFRKAEDAYHKHGPNEFRLEAI
jgi:uncharacterized protein YdaU (DUF1376 family)